MAVRGRPRLLVAEPQYLADEARRILNDAFEVTTSVQTAAEIPAGFRNYDAIWIRLGHRITAETVGSEPRCRVLAVPATGLEHIDVAACEAVGIEVISLRGETDFLRNIRATAEHTLSLLLALLRQLPHAHESVLMGRWDRDEFRGGEVCGRTVGLVGLGRLGSLVAEYVRALGAHTIAYDPRVDFPNHIARRCATLDELLGTADVVSIHVALDAGTRHLIGHDEIWNMRPGSLLINTSRGEVLDELALIAALESGRLAGAALDVIAGEPQIDGDHPVVRYARANRNLILTPHIGGNTIESGARTDVFIADRLAVWFERSR